MGLFGLTRLECGTHLPASAKPALPAQAPHIELNTVAELPADVRAKAAERLLFVRLVRSVIAARKINAEEACAAVAAGHAAEFPILVRAGRGGVSALSYNNYRAWFGAIRQLTADDQRLLALADDYRRGDRKRRGPDKFWQLFFGMYLTLNRLPVTVAYRRTCAVCHRDYPETALPTLAQARYQAAKLPPAMLILAREGEEAAKNRVIDYISRDWSAIRPGEVVVGDSRTFDTRVKVWDNDRQRWLAVRPTIAGLMDAKSWYLVSYWITAEPVNSATLIDTLALYLNNTQGVPPRIMYLDNGKDYCAAGFSKPFISPDGTEHSIFRELGIRLVNSLAYNGRAKTIERRFRDMMYDFDKVFPDYLGSRPGGRNMAADYYDTHAEELPTLAQFCELFSQYSEAYHTTPKSGKIHAGRTPADIWAGRITDPALTPERLQTALYQPVAVRQVGRGPAIQWNNRLYYCDKLRFGDKVLVKTSRIDADSVMLCHLNGALIGYGATRNAIAALALDDESGRRAIAEAMANQRRQLREAQTMLTDLTGGLHRVSPLELFLAPPDSEIAAGGVRRSVKGAAHRYRHYFIPAANLGVIPDAAGLELIEDEEAARLAEFGEAVDAPDTPASAPDKAELEQFHQFTTHRHNDEY